MGLAQQFGRPSGVLGAVVGRGMAKGNAALSRWVVDRVAAHLGRAPERIAELGPGPGVGLEALLATFPDAQVWGVDISSVMLSQSRKRNRAAVEAGRLTLLEGGVDAVRACAPADLVMANHVLYFWTDPVADLVALRSFLRPGGVLALGYQLRPHMPAMAQKRFPAAGHRLYETEEDVTSVAVAGGFTSVVHEVEGTREAPEGRIMLATA
ncbi:methyltransferase domain-containing protein [Nocardioides anomalus]|uniref:Methyltransferase domain-containing protein n=1 Tax=Nocardioides anomalus TaxID=2712223 RepID=A0A6G6WBJ3_9ACTN|nr:methyltransferase domain-containing protein [Nocardioides anomalus]QIG42410.1 methyltransferase domain-containing protein [Nocardioides anomalus]